MWAVWWRAGQTTDKSDVYAFGVVVLEMMTGMQAVDARRPAGCEALPQLLQPALQAVQLMQVTFLPCCTSFDAQHNLLLQHALLAGQGVMLVASLQQSCCGQLSRNLCSCGTTTSWRCERCKLWA